jgi:hypothetical protein
MEKICKTCKWSTPTSNVLRNKKFYKCHCPKLKYDNSPEKDELCYMDSEGYNASLSVGPNFGCVHWKDPVKE